MNPLAKIQLKKDKRDLSDMANEIERLLRKAGDLAEKISGSENLGYVFVSNLDSDNLTTYLIGNPLLITEILMEAAIRNPDFGGCLMAASDLLKQAGK